MKEPTEDDARLEELLDRTLRPARARRAPSTLESRVQGELRRRAALPWWRRSFANWPALARAGFVLICVALVGAVYLSGNWTSTNVEFLQRSSASSLAAVHQMSAVLTAAGELAAVLTHVIPSTWLYAALVAGSLLYVTLFGLGSAAYRTLYVEPLNGR
jgi:hypothetical protein